jgi:hypothetical protein
MCLSERISTMVGGRPACCSCSSLKDSVPAANSLTVSSSSILALRPFLFVTTMSSTTMAVSCLPWTLRHVACPRDRLAPIWPHVCVVTYDLVPPIFAQHVLHHRLAAESTSQETEDQIPEETHSFLFAFPFTVSLFQIQNTCCSSFQFHKTCF